ncbi:hypothetical protein [Amycolatopsis sp. La24]|uniref:hypothetical protein n=1 Tax=Amycolatopsis sp. La24 TaxID=3028304 RepID=UPI0023B0B8B1|nr:hypothetical protein [Amycolatopsis sp. La24]
MTSSVYVDLALVALLAAAFWAAPALARPTLPFGVRVPAARVAEPEIVRAHRRYARGVLVAGTLAFVLVADEVTARCGSVLESFRAKAAS